jgi:hypothetical protein
LLEQARELLLESVQILRGLFQGVHSATIE